MKQKELTKRFMIEKKIGRHGLYINIQSFNSLTAGTAYIRVFIFC